MSITVGACGTAPCIGSERGKEELGVCVLVLNGESSTSLLALRLFFIAIVDDPVRGAVIYSV